LNIQDGLSDVFQPPRDVLSIPARHEHFSSTNVGDSLDITTGEQLRDLFVECFVILMAFVSMHNEAVHRQRLSIYLVQVLNPEYEDKGRFQVIASTYPDTNSVSIVPRNAAYMSSLVNFT
jgi:hypothetical protein